MEEGGGLSSQTFSANRTRAETLAMQATRYPNAS